MSEYRVCMMNITPLKLIEFVKFDDKEDAEHYAKNQSMVDSKHSYEVQKNDVGEFIKIKVYLKGKEIPA